MDGTFRPLFVRRQVDSRLAIDLAAVRWNAEAFRFANTRAE